MTFNSVSQGENVDNLNPESVESAMSLHGLIMETLPFALSVSPLDCESLNVMFGFDFTYRGNHNQLVADALGVTPAMERLLEIPGSSVVAWDPTFQIALDNECKMQCRLSIESRTSAYHVRTGEFPEEQISVYLTIRRYGSFNANDDLVGTTKRMANLCREIVDDHIVDHVLRPLQQTIALR